MPVRRFTDDERIQMAKIYFSKKREVASYTMKELAKEYGVTPGAISTNIKWGVFAYLKKWVDYQSAEKSLNDLAKDLDMHPDALYHLLYSAIMRNYSIDITEQEKMIANLK